MVVTYDEISTDPIAWYELPAETPDRFLPYIVINFTFTKGYLTLPVDSFKYLV